MFASRFRTAASAGVIGAAVGTVLTELLRGSKISPLPNPVQAAEPLPIQHEVPSLPIASESYRPTEVMKLGFPGTDNIRYFSDYVLSYDKRNRTANWVMEHLTRTNTAKNTDVNRSACDFHEDKSVHSYFRSTNADYVRSGFDRGHLAAAANHRRTQRDMDETFVLSNIAPQVGKGFNRDSWNRLEMHVRDLTRKYKHVYVCTGPLYLPRREADGKLYIHYQVIGESHVAVPTHFFKVAVGETEAGQLDMEAYVMPNAVIDDSTPLEAFMVPLDTIERASGLLLFNRISELRSFNGKSSVKLLRPPS